MLDPELLETRSCLAKGEPSTTFIFNSQFLIFNVGKPPTHHSVAMGIHPVQLQQSHHHVIPFRLRQVEILSWQFVIANGALKARLNIIIFSYRRSWETLFMKFDRRLSLPTRGSMTRAPLPKANDKLT